MKAKVLKAWLEKIPDDAQIHVLQKQGDGSSAYCQLESDDIQAVMDGPMNEEEPPR